MSWEKGFDRYGSLIEEELQVYLAKTVKEAGEYHPFMAKVYSALQEFVLRKGKRLVSCSTLLTYEGYTGKIDDNILKVCAGIELYRHCFLVHDDLVDKDNFRRGGRTLHEIFMEDYDDRFGEGTAVFVGDAAYALAMDAVANSEFSKDGVVKSLLLLSKSYREINESQILDLLFMYRDVDVDEWLVMASKRATSLFKTAMLIGAILGGASEEDQRILEEAAINIGYSFDIQDDIIDTFADEEHYGKPPCSDVTLGRKPLHMIYAVKLAEQDKAEALRSLFGKRLSQEDISVVRTIVRESGGLKAAKKMLNEHTEKAKALIAKTNLRMDAKELFSSLISYIEESLDWYS